MLALRLMRSCHCHLSALSVQDWHLVSVTEVSGGHRCYASSRVMCQHLATPVPGNCWRWLARHIGSHVAWTSVYMNGSNSVIGLYEMRVFRYGKITEFHIRGCSHGCCCKCLYRCYGPSFPSQCWPSGHAMTTIRSQWGLWELLRTIKFCILKLQKEQSSIHCDCSYKYHLSLSNPHNTLHKGICAANTGGSSVQ